MKSKKILIPIVLIACCIIITGVILLTSGKKEIFITSEDDTKKFNDTYEKVTVDLNGKDKAVFIVLKGDMNKEEDLLLIYDGLYVKSDDEAYYTYKKGKELLNNLKWTNASKVRLLTVDEAKLLGCTSEDETCDWMMEESDSEVSVNNQLFGEYGMGFILERKDDSANRVYYVNLQGYLMDDKEDEGETYGLRPVIQISSEYVKPFATVKKIKVKKDNQEVTAKFLKDKLTKLEIENNYSNLTEEEYNSLKSKIDAREDTDNITYSSSSMSFDSKREIHETISIKCKDALLEEVTEYIKISSLNLTSSQFIKEMETIGYSKIK